MDEDWSDPFDTPERRALRSLTRDFVVREVRPHLGQWEAEGALPRSLHRRAAEVGLRRRRRRTSRHPN